VPPPTRNGEHVFNAFEDDVLKLGQGVALAFECHDGFWFTTCTDATAKVDDPTIAKVFPAHLEHGKDPWGQSYGTASQRSAFVIVGVAKGQTTIRVTSSNGVRDVSIVVD
jgi:hypothetical protein